MLRKKTKEQKIGDNISLEQRDDVYIIHISSNLSYQTADELRTGYEQLENGNILIDLGQVTLTTSRGMATLISIILESSENNQQVCLCSVSRPCMNIIEAMEIMKHVESLKIFDTLDEGVEYIHNS